VRDAALILNEGINGAMDFYLQRLQDAIVGATEGMTPEALGRRPQPDKWSAAEILEHLYLTYTGTIRGFENCLAAGKPLARPPNWKDRAKTGLVVGLGYLPAGRKSPKYAEPRGIACDRVLAEFVDKIVAMDDVIGRAEEKFGGRVPLIDHPIIGPLRAAQWRKFHWVHGRHHLKQLQRLREGAASFEPRASSKLDSNHGPQG
jgi:DinB superfamily